MTRSWVVWLALVAVGAGPASPGSGLPRIAANDNRRPAGSLRDGELTLELRVRRGAWWPDGDRRPAALAMAAFAEGHATPTIPGPLIRVRAGTRIRIHLRNELASGVTVHGLMRRPAAGDEAVPLPAGGIRDVEFDAGDPGTYYYWAATSDTATMLNRDGEDSQLNGAIVVDPATGPVAPDRIFVLGLFELPPADSSGLGPFGTVINGRSWPSTERLHYAVGDTVRWRWINPTIDNHPMHLHGFFYRVDARGDGLRDTAYAADQRRHVVTERMDEGSTMRLTWVPERPGYWLMHCHIMAHAMFDSTWGMRSPPAGDALGHMAGLVLGVDVRGEAAAEDPAGLRGPVGHEVRLVLTPGAGRDSSVPLAPRVEDARTSGDLEGYPGQPLILRRGERSRITVVNRLDQPAVVHWHGLELQSYYDGVWGWSGVGTRRSPAIAPGDSFVAELTPPRAGTFIYHSHMQTTSQVGDGAYGPVLVLEPGEAWQPEGEIIWIIGGRDLFFGSHLTLNGSLAPPPLTLQAGKRYRVRLINITESNTGDLALLSEADSVSWTPLAKDGAPLPASLALPRRAVQRTSVGETWDFLLTPPHAGEWRLELRNTDSLQLTQRIVIH